MKKALTLSIVIPVYNEESRLAYCLDAIAAQTVKPDEVIVVDNNSTDQTASIARNYKFVTIIEERHQGIIFAVKKGFNTGQSEIICRIDADTRLPAVWLEQVRNYFVNHEKVAAVTGDCYFYDFPFRRSFKIIHHAIYYTMQKNISGTEILWGSNMAIRKNAWQAVKTEALTTPGIPEDIDLSLRLHDKGYIIRRSPNMVAEVSLRHGNLSPISIISYLWPWPKTYWVNKRKLQSVFVGALLCLVWFVVLPLSIVVSVAAGLRKLIQHFFA